MEIIMPGEAGADQLVASGKAEFGVGYQESLTEARVQDVPLVSIGAVIQHNTSGFASPADKKYYNRQKTLKEKPTVVGERLLKRKFLSSLMHEGSRY